MVSPGNSEILQTPQYSEIPAASNGAGLADCKAAPFKARGIMARRQAFVNNSRGISFHRPGISWLGETRQPKILPAQLPPPIPKHAILLLPHAVYVHGRLAIRPVHSDWQITILLLPHAVH
eukprot:scaffold99818_cov12-Tisochrysis_lutea.AAC.1